MPSSSTAQPAPSSSNIPSVFRNSSNLYLITFLATLFLLLFVSCAIVLRSFVLRRRYQQHLDEAYTAGIMLAPQAQGSRKRRYGHKPKLYTSWVAQGGGEKWMDMMPVSALPFQAKRRKNTHRSSSKQVQEPPSTPPSRSVWPLFRHDRIIRPPTIVTNSEKSVRVDRLQVSVLIAMPSPNKPSDNSRSSIDKGSDEDSIPNVVFGVTRIPYKHSNQIT
ncbi:hypothetical protein E4T56_gene16125 [Termitomyces sp. T112]|nr:hypothetical protein E4T56_gene16125 [Termitomyces sp. T112]